MPEINPPLYVTEGYLEAQIPFCFQNCYDWKEVKILKLKNIKVFYFNKKYKICTLLHWLSVCLLHSTLHAFSVKEVNITSGSQQLGLKTIPKGYD